MTLQNWQPSILSDIDAEAELVMKNLAAIRAQRAAQDAEKARAAERARAIAADAPGLPEFPESVRTAALRRQRGAATAADMKMLADTAKAAAELPHLAGRRVSRWSR